MKKRPAQLVVIGQARSWEQGRDRRQQNQHPREAWMESAVARLRKGAVDLARSLGEKVPTAFTCDECPCAPRCVDSFDLENVDGHCRAIGK